MSRGFLNPNYLLSRLPGKPSYPPIIYTHPSKTGEELSYYHLYHEEAQYYLEVHPRLFNRTFIIFSSLSSQ